MCLVAFAFDTHPRYALAIAANRDEFHARAAEHAHWWTEGWLAGRDLEAGGAWFGVRRDGRFALVTNVREDGRRETSLETRGSLVTGALEAPAVERYVTDLGAAGQRYNGYNLVTGDARRALWQSNRHGAPQALAGGVHALSNAQLDTPWPKTGRIRAAMSAWSACGDDALDPLFDALADRSLAPDGQLPSTGVPLDRERMLSAPFIVSERYGTRCSTVFVVGRDGEARFVERAFDATGELAGEVDERFRVAP